MQRARNELCEFSQFSSSSQQLHRTAVLHIDTSLPPYNLIVNVRPNQDIFITPQNSPANKNLPTSNNNKEKTSKCRPIIQESSNLLLFLGDAVVLGCLAPLGLLLLLLLLLLLDGGRLHEGNELLVL